MERGLLAGVGLAICLIGVGLVVAGARGDTAVTLWVGVLVALCGGGIGATAR